MAEQLKEPKEEKEPRTAKKKPPEEALDCLPFPVGIQNSSWRLTYQNKQHREMFGDCLGRLCYEVNWNKPESCPDCPIVTGRDSIKTGVANALGSVRVRSSLFDGADGDCVVETYDRFSEDEPMVAALKEAFERAATAMLILDSMGKVLGANKSAASLWNAEVSALNKASIYDLFAEETARLLENSACGKGADALRIEAAKRKENPKPTLEIETAPISGGDEPLTMLLARKESETTLAQQAFLTAQTEKAEAFIQTVAHDLRTPLVSLKGYATFLKKELVDGNPRHKSFAERIVSQADRLDLLLEALLEFARVGKDRKPVKALDVEASAHAAWHDLSVQVREAGAVLQVEGPLPDVYISPVSMSQILYNLFANSLKFRREGVAPEIRLKSVEPAGNAQTDFVCIAVADNGVGVAPEDRNVIFDLFRQGSRTANSVGTGVGLAIVQRIVHTSGGKIWVESQPGHGSVFYMNLPAARPDKNSEEQ